MDIHDSSSTSAQEVTEPHYFDNAYWMPAACQYSNAGRAMDKVDMVSSPHGGNIDLQTGIYHMVCQITG